MENTLEPVALTEDQRRIYIDSCQVYEAYQAAQEDMKTFKGGMYWKKSKGKQYLFRSINRKGNGRSLGPRTPESEQVLITFQRRKEQLKQKVESLRQRLAQQARFCKAAMIQRAPTAATKISSLLDTHGLLGKRLLIAGTNALYAYEAAAGVFLDTAIVATRDLDIVMDSRGEISLSGEQKQACDLLDILRKADSSFSLIRKDGFRAINKNGYMVDLIRPMPSPPWKEQAKSIGGANDLQAADIRKLDWLISSPKLSQIIIGADGFPSRMVVPDPRAFIIHKLWLSHQKDRDPVKKPRDRAQAVAVAHLVAHYLPQYKFVVSKLRMFPKSAVRDAERIVRKIGG